MKVRELTLNVGYETVSGSGQNDLNSRNIQVKWAGKMHEPSNI